MCSSHCYLQPPQEIILFPPSAQQCCYFSPGWLCVFQEFDSDSKIHEKKTHWGRYLHYQRWWRVLWQKGEHWAVGANVEGLGHAHHRLQSTGMSALLAALTPAKARCKEKTSTLCEWGSEKGSITSPNILLVPKKGESLDLDGKLLFFDFWLFLIKPFCEKLAHF